MQSHQMIIQQWDRLWRLLHWFTIPVIIIYALLLDGAQSVLADDNKMQITEELAEKLRAHGDKLILGICVCTTPDEFL